MGGHALKHVPCARVSLARYQEVQAQVAKCLTDAGLEYAFIPYVPTKTDFGDLDVLVLSSSALSGDWTSFVQSTFAPDEMVVNGPVVSFNIGTFQVDFIQVESLAFARFYYSYSVFGNIVGHLTHSYRLSFGHYGLALDTDPGSGDGLGLLLSCDVGRVAEFLGLDLERWTSVQTIEDVYRLVVSSHLFTSVAFTNLNNKARTRARKRPEYNAFLEYISVVTQPKEQVVISDLRPSALAFFGKQAEYDSVVEAERRRSARAAKYHGGLFVQCGLKGKDVGVAKEAFALVYSDAWIDAHTAEEVQIAVCEWLQN